jgi:hypothetical protein
LNKTLTGVDAVDALKKIRVIDDRFRLAFFAETHLDSNNSIESMRWHLPARLPAKHLSGVLM